MRDKLVFLMSGRYFIALINLLLLASGINALRTMLPLLNNAANDILVLEHISEGYGTILIAFGVATEERESLMRFFGLYPRHQNPLQTAVDHVCHDFGLSLLLLGLFMELGVQAIKLPNEIVNTDGLEHLIFGATAALMALTSWVLARFTFLLFFPHRHKTGAALADAHPGTGHGNVHGG